LKIGLMIKSSWFVGGPTPVSCGGLPSKEGNLRVLGSIPLLRGDRVAGVCKIMNIEQGLTNSEVSQACTSKFSIR